MGPLPYAKAAADDFTWAHYFLHGAPPMYWDDPLRYVGSVDILTPGYTRTTWIGKGVLEVGTPVRRTGLQTPVG